MKIFYTTSILLFFIFTLAGCGVSDKKYTTETVESNKTSQMNEKSLNDLMIIFSNKIETYIYNDKKDLKALEEMHLAFVPILRWEQFKGDETYNKAALSVGSIVHRLEELDGEEYNKLLNGLEPAYLKFHNKYGE